MQQSHAFFIVSSGRSGTAMLHKVLSSLPGVEMHHEYAVEITQPLAVRRYLGLTERKDVLAILRTVHGAAVHHSEAAHWGDSSNKLSWLIPELAELFPNGRVIHLVRDGSKVAGSYFRKLGDECYDDRSNAVMQGFYDDPAQIPPPPEKKYWWPVPRRDDPLAGDFRRFDQFSRIAWHWAEINRVILSALSALAPERQLFIRLEDLRRDPASLAGLFAFLGLRGEKSHFAMFNRPHNVNRPEDSRLSEPQRAAFTRIAGTMMARLGYAGTDEYVVKY